jgi:hypothetical protein
LSWQTHGLGAYELEKSYLKTQPDRTHTHGLGGNFCSKLNPTTTLHITRNRDAQKLWLSQKFYIKKLISKFNIDINSKTLESSLFLINIFSLNVSDSSFKINNDLIKYERIVMSQQIQIYQQRVEFINFAAVIIRSNVAQIVSKLSEFLINSSKFHMKLTNHTLKYLSHTRKLIIKFNAN